MKFLRSILWLLPPLGFFLWSFTLTDRSLYLTSFKPYLTFQEFMWRFAAEHILQTKIYILLIALFFIGYFVFLKRIREVSHFRFKSYVVPLIVILLFFTFSMNALSYDLYNYMFDAKLVIHYHLDPHTTAAASLFSTDTWVGFMRNIIYPTTYGYAWTFFSLIPFLIGIGKLLSVFLAFKLYALLALGLLFLVERKILEYFNEKESFWKLMLFFVSPLVLIEALSSAHNDIWMLLPAFTSLLLFLRQKQQSVFNVLLRVALSFLMLFVSIQVKRATIFLFPLWFYFLFRFISGKKVDLLDRWWGDFGAILMFLPLLTELSRHFHPWYLIWSLSFLPFVRSRLIRTLLITFSITSLLRYTPVLYTGMYSVTIEAVQRTITWSAIPIGLVIYYFYSLYLGRRKSK